MEYTYAITPPRVILESKKIVAPKIVAFGEEVKAQDYLASVKAETLVAQQYRVTAESQINKPKKQSSNNSREKLRCLFLVIRYS